MINYNTIILLTVYAICGQISVITACPSKMSRFKSLFWGIVIAVAGSSIFNVLLIFIRQLDTLWMYALFVNIPTFLYATFTSKRKFKSGMIAAFNVFIFFAFIFTINLSLQKLLPMPWLGIVFVVIMTILLNLFLKYVYNKLHNEIEKWFSEGLSWLFFLSCVGFIIIWMFIISLSLRNLDNGLKLVFFAIYICLVVLFYIILQRLVAGYKRKLIEKHDEKMFLSKFHTIKSQLANIEENEKNIAVLWHDLRHYATSMQLMLNEGKIDEAKAVAEKLGKDVSSYQKEVFSDSLLVNAVISSYKSLSHKESITFQADIRAKLKEIADENEIALFLCNCLENAANACVKLPKEKRYISITSNMKDGNIVLCIKNSHDGVVKQADFVELDINARHGIGMHSIKRFADKNNIILDYCITAEEFAITAYFSKGNGIKQ